MRKVNTTIKYIEPYSIAEDAGIEVGDKLISINGHDFHDILEYRYLTAEYEVTLEILKKDGTTEVITVENDYDDIGIEFEEGLIDEAQSCRNKCIFCFIDQLPKGMRETVYFKDDDTRLSFLQGNYVTLTNMSDEEIDRLIKMRVSPINVSVQATNPELRCKMLNNRFAGKCYDIMKKFAANNIYMNCQIVLCPEINDGKELDRSISELAALFPNVNSVSIVPVGLTRYRDGLYPLESFTKEDAKAVLEQIHRWQKIMYEKHGIHFIHASDEWYILAGEKLPEEGRYDGYLQLENGVGMLRLLDTEVREAVANRDGDDRSYHVTVATGRLAAPYIEKCMETIREKYPKITFEVIAIKNNFFGEKITVSGLITGQDLTEQLSDRKLGDRLLIPCNMLRSGENVFLDDITVTELSEKLGREIIVVDPAGADLVSAVLDSTENKKQIRRQMYEQTGSGNSGQA